MCTGFPKSFRKMKWVLSLVFFFLSPAKTFKKCSREHFLKVLAGDKKKNTSESTHFIFLKDLGKPVHISKGFEEISKQFFIRSSE